MADGSFARDTLADVANPMARRHDPAADRVIDRLRDPIRLLPDARDMWREMPRNAPISFDDAARIVRDHAAEDGARHDVGAGALDRIAVQADPSGLLHMLKTEQRGGRIEAASLPIPLREHAFAQLATRAKAPAAYLRSLPAALAVSCLQHGLRTSEADTAGLVRMAGPEARAIVTSSYAAIDDESVMDAIDHALSRHGLRGSVMVRAVATGRVTTLRLTVPSGAVEVKRGDVVEWGIDVTNGELGSRSLSIAPMVWRLVCTNGMRAAERNGATRKIRHVGEATARLTMLHDALPAALNTARGQIDLLKVASERAIADVADAFDMLGSRFGLAQSEVEGATRAAFADRGMALPASTRSDAWMAMLDGAGGDLTSYDVLNGITAYARSVGTERRLDLEGIAGRYLAHATR